MIRKSLTTIPGVMAALLPNATCPACWPVYAGILSSLGLGFLMTGPYFLVFVSVLLIASLFALFYRANVRRGYGPFALGLLAAVVILAGKGAGASDYFLYAGAVLLITASLWNNLPKNKVTLSANNTNVADCPHCNATNPSKNQVKE